MRRTALVWVLAAGLAAAAGCKSEPNEGKMMPRLAPTPGAEVPASLSIDVEIDGAPAAAIDAKRLSAVPPDFADEDRRAWRLSTLLGPAAAGEGATIAAVDARDLAVELRPRTKDGLVAVIMVSRRADVIATMLDEKDPFPTFHGQGGRLGRPPGETVPRVANVKKLRVTTKAP